ALSCYACALPDPVRSCSGNKAIDIAATGEIADADLDVLIRSAGGKLGYGCSVVDRQVYVGAMRIRPRTGVTTEETRGSHDQDGTWCHKHHHIKLISQRLRCP